MKYIAYEDGTEGYKTSYHFLVGVPLLRPALLLLPELHLLHMLKTANILALILVVTLV